MNRNAIIGALVLIFFLCGIIFYAATKPATENTSMATEVPILGPSEYIEHTASYDINAYYASSTPLLARVGGAADAAAIALMKKFVGDTIAQFKTDGNKDRKETLQIAYLIASSPHTVSYIFTTYEDTLGAHGNIFFRTFTFDTSTGAPLMLADIFSPGSDYLAVLSQISRTKLPGVIGDRADADFIKSGTAPEDKNFSSFFFDNRDFVILFAPYAVAPYSSGPQTLRIPVSELSNILRTAYRQ